MQLALLEECKLIIQSKIKQSNKSIKPKTGSVKLRQSVKKFSNKENTNIEYEFAFDNLKVVFDKIQN